MRKNNRDKILKTARRLLLRYGYNGISIREIAKKANLTTGAIYFHFKNKREIYTTICNEAIDVLLTKFKEAIKKGKTVNQKLISIYDSYVEFYRTHPDYYNIIMEYKSDYSQKADKELLTKFKELADITAQTYELGIKEGVFRRIDPRLMSLFLASLTEGMIQYKKIGLFDLLNVEDREFRRFMADVVGKGIEVRG
ncbi:MAG: TetR/AcrR family transcriptional regulator [Spirochaetes bacterium]|nr:TetR/AcrR family transcriptional regulator [Spirochaetota bacterium]